MAEPAPSAPPTRAAGRGCLLALLALPVVIVVGALVGTALSGDDDAPEEVRTTLDEGEVDGARWEVQAVRDVEGDICTFLLEDGRQLTGACTVDPQDASFGDQTVVFGRAEGAPAQVAVELSDGRVVEIDTVAADGVDGRFYVQVVDGDVDAERVR